MVVLDGTAGVVTIDGTVVVELIAFLIMLAILSRYVYPELVKRAEARQRQIADQLRDAEKARADAEAALKEATQKLNDARAQAQSVIDGATKSGEQLRKEMKEHAEEDARRITESARREIDGERKKAIESVRSQVADLVIGATEKVIGETLDPVRHRKLIDEAIEQVGSGQRQR